MADVLIRPQITEKALTRMSQHCYTFKVNPKVNKRQIAEAISKMYKVEVTKVNIIRVPAKKVYHRGQLAGEKRSWKKAVITLKKDQKIPGFEEK